MLWCDCGWRCDLEASPKFLLVVQKLDDLEVFAVPPDADHSADAEGGSGYDETEEIVREVHR